MREGGGRGSAPFVMRVGVVWVGCGGEVLYRGRFCLPGWGQNHFFFCGAKEKAVLDSEKEKVDQWK